MYVYDLILKLIINLKLVLLVVWFFFFMAVLSWVLGMCSDKFHL